MATSLFTALSGLQSHQSWIDVIGNNLANTNTPGFKTSRASFSAAFVALIVTAMVLTRSCASRRPSRTYGSTRESSSSACSTWPATPFATPTTAG